MGIRWEERTPIGDAVARDLEQQRRAEAAVEFAAERRRRRAAARREWLRAMSGPLLLCAAGLALAVVLLWLVLS